MCVGGLLFVPRCEEKQKGLLGHWLTYSGFSFLSPPLMAVFSSLSIIGPIISSSFSLSSSWMISISLTGSTVPSTWMISSSSKAPAETGHVARLYRISDLFSAGTRPPGQRVKRPKSNFGFFFWFFFGLKYAARFHLRHKIINVP